ncbi:MAG: serine/threonine-protein phosphatase [Anaerolineales bacterium]|nr:serine/threonine-protein phosphatase [Anaerolineales bacterium]
MTSFIKRLFKTQTPEPAAPVAEPAKTTPLSPEMIEKEIIRASEKPTIPAEKLTLKKLDLPQFIVGCGHSVGKLREHNEDALFTLTTNLISDTTQLPFGLYIIADGMGGHQHGEVASGVSVRAMANHIIRKLYMQLFGLGGDHSEESLQEIMISGTQEAHRGILKDARGGGTTMTAVLLLGNQLTITHIGDSRAYLIHADGKMQCITHDHSLVKRLEELGHITAEEAAIHPQRNVLYRALGQGEPVEPDVSTLQIPRAGYLLICSDGLWGVIPESELFNIVATAADPQQACQLLVEAANAAGGPDNISVIVVRMPD